MALQPHSGRSNDLRLMATTPLEVFEMLRRRVEAGPYVLSSSDLADELERNTSSDVAEAIVRFVLGIRRNIDNREIRYDEYAKLIDREFEADDLVKFKADWSKRSPILGSIVESEFSAILAKASELSVLNEFHIHEIRIITEMRPVLSGDLSRTVAQIIKSELLLTVSDALEDEHRTTVTVGVDDLRELQYQVERALKKVEVLRSECEKQGLAVKVYGEAGHD